MNNKISNTKTRIKEDCNRLVSEQKFTFSKPWIKNTIKGLLFANWILLVTWIVFLLYLGIGEIVEHFDWSIFKLPLILTLLAILLLFALLYIAWYKFMRYETNKISEINELLNIDDYLSEFGIKKEADFFEKDILSFKFKTEETNFLEGFRFDEDGRTIYSYFFYLNEEPDYSKDLNHCFKYKATVISSKKTLLKKNEIKINIKPEVTISKSGNYIELESLDKNKGWNALKEGAKDKILEQVLQQEVIYSDILISENKVVLISKIGFLNLKKEEVEKFKIINYETPEHIEENVLSIIDTMNKEILESINLLNNIV